MWDILFLSGTLYWKVKYCTQEHRHMLKILNHWGNVLSVSVGVNCFHNNHRKTVIHFIYICVCVCVCKICITVFLWLLWKQFTPTETDSTFPQWWSIYSDIYICAVSLAWAFLFFHALSFSMHTHTHTIRYCKREFVCRASGRKDTRIEMIGVLTSHHIHTGWLLQSHNIAINNYRCCTSIWSCIGCTGIRSGTWPNCFTYQLISYGSFSWKLTKEGAAFPMK